MSRVPETETVAELSRLPLPTSLDGQHHHARKLIVALARESGIINADYNNIDGAHAIREIIDASLPRTGAPTSAAPTAERVAPPALPLDLRAPEKAQPVLRARMSPRVLTEQQQQRVVAVRAAFTAVEDVVLHVTAPGRLQSLVLTALEEGCMWAVKAISHENG